MMATEIVSLGCQDGIWSARVASDAEPDLETRYCGQDVEGVTLHREDGDWILRVPIPQAALCDGIQTILVMDRATGRTAGAFTLLLGDVAAADIRSELDFLHAEIDQLKRALRRCLSGGV